MKALYYIFRKTTAPLVAEFGFGAGLDRTVVGPADCVHRKLVECRPSGCLDDVESGGMRRDSSGSIGGWASPHVDCSRKIS